MLLDVVTGVDFLLFLLVGIVVGYVLTGSLQGPVLAASVAAALTGTAVLVLRGLRSLRRLQELACHFWDLLLAAVSASLGWWIIVSGSAEAELGSVWLWVTVASAAGLGVTFIHHVAIRHVLELLERTGRLRERVALFGSTRGTEHYLRLMAADGDTPEIVGVFSDNPDDQNGRKLVTGTLEDLVSLSRRERVDVVVLTFASHGKDALKAALDRLKTTVADIVTVSFEAPGAPNSRSVRLLGACPTAIIDERPVRDWNGIVKGGLDRTVAGLLLVLTFPLLVCVSVAIKLDSPGPVLFRQRRRGFNDEIFEIFKFRTMHHAMRDLNADRLTERGDPRITRVGQWLRRTSVDELPQLLNVLQGEMSLVGPRPHPLGAKAGTRLYADILDNYSRRHRVKPGITGWAQVNGWRGETTNEEQLRQRVQHDLYYVENWSLALDLKILFLTLCGGFGGKDVF